MRLGRGIDLAIAALSAASSESQPSLLGVLLRASWFSAGCLLQLLRHGRRLLPADLAGLAAFARGVRIRRAWRDRLAYMRCCPCIDLAIAALSAASQQSQPGLLGHTSWRTLRGQWHPAGARHVQLLRHAWSLLPADRARLADLARSVRIRRARRHRHPQMRRGRGRGADATRAALSAAAAVLSTATAAAAAAAAAAVALSAALSVAAAHGQRSWQLRIVERGWFE